MKLDLTQVIRRPLVTEKNMDRTERRNQYTFEVDNGANKVQIRQAVETLFKVKVASVKTINTAGKRKRQGFNWHTSGAIKKAIVSLQDGYKIEII